MKSLSLDNPTPTSALSPVRRSRHKSSNCPKIEWYESSGKSELRGPPEVDPVNKAASGMLYVHRALDGEIQVWLREVKEDDSLVWECIAEGHPYHFNGLGIRHFAFTKISGDPTWLKPTSPDYRRLLRVKHCKT